MISASRMTPFEEVRLCHNRSSFVSLLIILTDQLPFCNTAAGLAFPTPKHLPSMNAFRVCYCPLCLSTSGKHDDPRISFQILPDCVGDIRPCSTAHTQKSR